MCQPPLRDLGVAGGRQAARILLPWTLVPRLLSLRPWWALAFLASGGIACLNPQPEPPTESAVANDPGARGDDGATAGGAEVPGKGNAGSGGMSVGSGANGGNDPAPPDPNDGDGKGQGGDSGEFGDGDGGTGGSGGAGGRGGVMPPVGEAGGGGAGGSTDEPGGAGGGGAGGGGDDVGGDDCGSCSDVLDRGGNPCTDAIPKLAALVACCHEACGACKERIVRGDRVGNECESCLADACGDALLACKADLPIAVPGAPSRAGGLARERKRRALAEANARRARPNELGLTGRPAARCRAP